LRFERIPDDEIRLEALLDSKKLSRLKIQNPVCLRSVDSTQTFLANEMKSKREGDLVMSRIQTRGKGRENREWVSQDGGLWMTITFTPPKSDILPNIPVIATSSVVRTLGAYGLVDCSIKLPNDVYCGGKKIAGVLADATIEGSTSIVFVGLGVNVNNDPSEIDEISKIATSLKKISDKEFDLLKFASDLIENLDYEYSREITKY
jgi:BirA family transcriptional regulator, biotin operon repressor / biotin---[acetyl-CoA-carboxylase] ligase